MPAVTEITGEFRNHEFQQSGEIQVLKGFIYNDARERFNDGEYIRTSAVERIEGDLVFTRNSIYRIIN